MNQKTLLALAHEHGTPLFIVDHAELRKNYRLFKKHLPRVQAYYAVKVNSDPAIVETFYKLGGSFDVASMQEFRVLPASLRFPRSAGLHAAGLACSDVYVEVTGAFRGFKTVAEAQEFILQPARIARLME